MSGRALSGRRWRAGGAIATSVLATAVLAGGSPGPDAPAFAAERSPQAATIAPLTRIQPAPNGEPPAAPRVQLMFAVANAAAYERVMALVDGARLTAMDGEAFLVVGAFADARTGHELGLALQRRLGLPFELVYDPHHPQADLAWLNPGSAVAARTTIASARQPTSAPSSAPLPRQPEALRATAALRAAVALEAPTAATQPPLSAPPPKPSVTPEARVAPETGKAAEVLLYLYARPRDARQRQLLARIFGVQGAAVVPMPDTSPKAIRVGVFRETRRSLQLLKRRQEELHALGIPVERHRRPPGEPLLIGMAP